MPLPSLSADELLLWEMQAIRREILSPPTFPFTNPLACTLPSLQWLGSYLNPALSVWILDLILSCPLKDTSPLDILSILHHLFSSALKSLMTSTLPNPMVNSQFSSYWIDSQLLTQLNPPCSLKHCLPLVWMSPLSLGSPCASVGPLSHSSLLVPHH